MAKLLSCLKDLQHSVAIVDILLFSEENTILENVLFYCLHLHDLFHAILSIGAYFSVVLKRK